MSAEKRDLCMVPVAPRASTVEHATAEIRRAVLDGRMAPGATVSIAVVADQLGMSAIPVREALRALAAEGLVVLRPNRRAVVAPISVRELDDIFRAREIYEGELAALSAPLHTADGLRRLGEVVDAMAGEHAWEARIGRHDEFHELLVTPAASDFDWQLLRTIWRASDRYVRFNVHSLSDLDLRASHLLILEAARGGDPDAVRKAFTTQLNEGREVLRRAVLEAERD